MPRWRRIYECPACGACCTEWAYLCPCWACAEENKEDELIKRVGRTVWTPTWTDWFATSVDLKDKQ